MGFMGLFRSNSARKQESKLATGLTVTTTDSLTLNQIHEALKNPIIRTNLTYLANFLDVEYTSNKQNVNSFIRKFKINSNEIIFNLLAYGFCIIQVVDREVKVIPHYKINNFTDKEFFFDMKKYDIDNQNFFMIHLGYYPSLHYSVLYPLLDYQTFKFQGQTYRFNILSLYNALIYASTVDVLKTANAKTFIEVNEINNELLEQIRNIRLEENFILGQNIAKVTNSNTTVANSSEILKLLSDLLNLTTFGSFAKLIINEDMSRASSETKYQLLNDFVSHYREVIKEKIKEVIQILLSVNGMSKDFELIEVQKEIIDWLELYKLGVISKEELRAVMKIDDKIPQTAPDSNTS